MFFLALASILMFGPGLLVSLVFVLCGRHVSALRERGALKTWSAVAWMLMLFVLSNSLSLLAEALFSFSFSQLA
jgi:hypothetical protein